MPTITLYNYPIVLTRSQGKPLQTGFLKGMEHLLGVTYDASKHKTHQDWVQSRIRTVEADALDHAEGDSDLRTRYKRMFWEPVVEETVRDLSPPLVCVLSDFLIRMVSFPMP